MLVKIRFMLVTPLLVVAVLACGACAQGVQSGPPGMIVVTSNPANAYVFVDGDSAGIAPLNYSAQAGQHQVEVEYPGYQPYITDVTVPAGGTVQVNAALAPIPNPGLISIDSSPQGADIYVDGNYDGETPGLVGGLAAGMHQVVLVFPDYAPYTANVSVQAGQTTSINAVLAQATMAGFGDINIASQPAGASVYLDGVYQGVTVPDNIITLQAVPAGMHTIVFTLEGYQDYSQVIQVNEGQASTVAPVLTPVIQPAPNGTIVVVTSPSGGQVYLDGQFKGTAPISISPVPAGSHTLLVRLPGFQDSTQTLQLGAGQVVPINVLFAPVSTPTTVATSTAPPPTKTTISFPVLALLAAVVLGTLYMTGERR